MAQGNELVRACEQYLEIKRIFHYRNNSGAVKMAHGAFVRFGAAGSPDIIAVKDGRYIGIECKMGTGRQSESQKNFQAALEQAGGRYILARSIDDLVAAGF
jgi:Holliday junction resolvase